MSGYIQEIYIYQGYYTKRKKVCDDWFIHGLYSIIGYKIEKEYEDGMNRVNMIYYLSTTRFNHSTWNQNQRWRDTHDWEGCMYGTPSRIKQSIPTGAILFVLEMHNDINQIQGIGLIVNHVDARKLYRLYDHGNYNRYLYHSPYRIDRTSLTPEELKILAILDILVFKGSTHLKRGYGITSVPSWIQSNRHISFQKKIMTMFKKRYSSIRVPVY